MESIAQSLDGTPDLDKLLIVLFRTGDLVHKVYVKLDLKNKIDLDDSTIGATDKTHAGIIAICENLGSACMEQMDLEIGGQLIDRHYGHWLETWAKLTEPSLCIPEAVGQAGDAYGTDDVLIGPWTNFELSHTHQENGWLAIWEGVYFAILQIYLKQRLVMAVFLELCKSLTPRGLERQNFDHYTFHYNFGFVVTLDLPYH